MTTFSLNKFAVLLASLVMAVSLPTALALEIMDDFDAYPADVMHSGAILDIANASAPLRWETRVLGTNPDRTIAIESGAAYGERPGQVLAINNRKQAGVTYAFVETPPINEAEWAVSVDFYVDELVTDGSKNALMMVVAGFSSELENHTNVANRIFSFSVQKAARTGVISGVANVGESAVGEDSRKLIEGLSEKTWYTLTINGNNEKQTVSFKLTDGASTVEVGPFYYRKDTRQITRFTLGDLGSGQGGIAIDNFRFHLGVASETAMLLLSPFLFALAAGRRRKLQRARRRSLAGWQTVLSLSGLLLVGAQVEASEAAERLAPEKEITYKPAGLARKLWQKATEGENLAFGRRVTFSHEPRYHLSRDENDPMDLTDGKLSREKNDRIWFAKDSVGWTNADSGAMLLVDLEKSEPVGTVAIRVLGGKEQGSLVFPSEIEVIGSEDGKTFHTLAKVAKVTFSEKEEAEENPDEFFYLPEEGKAYMEPFTFPVNAKARYIALILRAPHGFLFSDELAVMKAGPEQKLRDLADLPARKIVAKGIAMLPRQSEIFITTNVVTPNWFFINDLRSEKTPVSFTMDLPEGISLDTSKGIAERQDHLKHKNRWVISNLYKGKQPPHSSAFGPFYFRVEEGVTIPEGSSAVITPEDPESTDNVQVVPIRLGTIPEVPALDALDVSLGWMEDTEAAKYPDFHRSFKAMGFNTVSTFPRNHRTPEAKQWLEEFVAKARKAGFRILYNESPFHVMWRVRKDESELRNQLSSGPGKAPCPSYTGEFYQEEINRVAAIARSIRPDFVFFDIELWHTGAREAERCSVCKAAFAQSGIESWEQFLTSLGNRMQHDLKAAIKGTAPDGKTPVSGDYSVNVENSPYHKVHDIRQLFPKYVDVVQPSLYNRGNVRATHQRMSANEKWMGKRALIPWLTPATYGSYPPHRLEQVILEAVLNGANGITYYSYWDFDAIHFYYHARALSRLAPYQTLLRNGKRISVEGTAASLLYSAAGNEHEALLLVSNDGKKAATTDLRLPGREVEEIKDVDDANANIASLESIRVPADGQRLLHVRFQQ